MRMDILVKVTEKETFSYLPDSPSFLQDFIPPGSLWGRCPAYITATIDKYRVFFKKVLHKREKNARKNEELAER